MHLPRDALDNLGRWASSGSGEDVRAARLLVVRRASRIAAEIRHASHAKVSDAEDDLLSGTHTYVIEHDVDDGRIGRAFEDLRCFRNFHAPEPLSDVPAQAAEVATSAARELEDAP